MTSFDLEPLFCNLIVKSPLSGGMIYGIYSNVEFLGKDKLDCEMWQLRSSIVYDLM